MLITHHHSWAQQPPETGRLSCGLLRMPRYVCLHGTSALHVQHRGVEQLGAAVCGYGCELHDTLGQKTCATATTQQTSKPEQSVDGVGKCSMWHWQDAMLMVCGCISKHSLRTHNAGSCLRVPMLCVLAALCAASASCLVCNCK